MFKRLFKKSAESKPKTPNKKSSTQTRKSTTQFAKGQQRQNPRPNNKRSQHLNKRNPYRSNRTETRHSAWALDEFNVAPEAGKTRFHDLGLPDVVMRGIHQLGFQYCSPIQAETLPATLRGRDAIGQAQTGTGKSAAFLLTILNRLLTLKPVERFASEPRALVIAPTRELVLQIGKDAEDLAKFTDLNIVTIVGGMDYENQRQQLRNKEVDLLVATPGRLIDFMTSQDVFLDQVEVLVLDEADRMLDMGFIPDVRRIVRATPAKEHRQTLLFSATFNYDVRILIDQWTTDPLQVVIEPETVATDRVEQHAYLVADVDKYKLLEKVLDEQQPELCIIFANRRDLTRNLCDKLNKRGHKAVLLSGEVSQEKRIKTLERFREGKAQIMVATDVAGRGIHVDGVSHVINYTLPEDPEDYVHRIGRTGRAGAKGVSISFVSEDDAFVLPALEKYLGQKLELTQPEM